MTPVAEAQTRASAGIEVPLPYRVTGTAMESSDVVTLELEPTLTAVPEPLPGQFNMLWRPGIGEAPISASAVGSGGRLVHTIRSVGAVTESLTACKPGDAIGVRGPFGIGWDLAAAHGRDLVVVAGGIGLAPLRPVVHAVLADRDAFGQVSLVVGARTSAMLIFRRELDGWWRDADIQVRAVVDHPSADWHGNVGVVTTELRRVDVNPANTVAMVCGPEVMIRFTGTKLADMGLHPERIQVSLERRMECGTGRCGHCQLADIFVCRDGPVLTWRRAAPLTAVREW